LAETLKAEKRQRLDRENDEKLKAVLRQQQHDEQKAADANAAYRGSQSAPKSHYMFNTPLIPKVIWTVVSS